MPLLRHAHRPQRHRDFLVAPPGVGLPLAKHRREPAGPSPPLVATLPPPVGWRGTARGWRGPPGLVPCPRHGREEEEGQTQQAGDNFFGELCLCFGGPRGPAPGGGRLGWPPRTTVTAFPFGCTSSVSDRGRCHSTPRGWAVVLLLRVRSSHTFLAMRQRDRILDQRRGGSVPDGFAPRPRRTRARLARGHTRGTSTHTPTTRALLCLLLSGPVVGACPVCWRRWGGCLLPRPDLPRRGGLSETDPSCCCWGGWPGTRDER